MSGEDEEPRGPDLEDDELEREVLSRRRYSLSEAIGRAAGDLMKGASPVTRKRQAEVAMRQYLESHLADSEGALGSELLRRVSDSERSLEESYEHPLATLADIARGILASPARLRGFVRQVDAEWGRMYSRRPYFDQDEAAPGAEDPYTVASVREALVSLLDDLRRDAEC